MRIVNTGPGDVSVGARDVDVGGHSCRRGCRERGVARALRSAFPSRPGTMMTCMTSLEGEKKNKTRARGPRVAKQMSRVSSHDCRERDAYFSNTPQPKPSWSEADGAAPRPRSRPARRGPRATLAWQAPGARLKYKILPEYPSTNTFLCPSTEYQSTPVQPRPVGSAN